jgi:hypothetical protein
LPRLVGVPTALQMISSGAIIAAERALEIGAIDEIAQGDLEAAAIAAARRLATPGTILRRTGTLPVAPVAPEIFQEARRQASEKQRHLQAPLTAIEAVAAAASLSFDEGLRREREWFLERRASAQAAALRNAFLGEREVARVPGLAADVRAREIVQVAVLGAGTMGSGIAMCFANAGFSVLLKEVEALALERGMATIRKNYQASVSRGTLSPQDMQRRLECIRPTLDWQALAEVDLVVEAVFEDLTSNVRCSNNSMRLPGRAPSSPPIPPISMSHRLPNSRGDRRMWWECTSSVRPTSCACWRTCVQTGLPPMSWRQSCNLARNSARSPFSSAGAMVSLATACLRKEHAKPGSCWKKERYRSRWTRR